VRPDLPSGRDQEDEDEDRDDRRDDRYDVRRSPYSRDQEHLRILSILYYVFGGLGVFGGLFPLIYVVIGFVLLSIGPTKPGGPPGPPPEFVAWLMIGFGGGISLFLLALAGCALFTGYNLSRKKRYMFCFVDACICCIQVPLGTILGVFTIVVLARPGVKELFDNSPTEARLAPEE
jgi:hypothetical protein